MQARSLCAGGYADERYSITIAQLCSAHCRFGAPQSLPTFASGTTIIHISLAPLQVKAPQRLRTCASGITVIQLSLASLQVGAPQRLRTFASGITVVESASHSDSEVCNKIAKMVQCAEGLGPSIGPSDVAKALGTPVSIAAEHLLMAEAQRVLCRDDGPEGLRFYRNFFAEAAVSSGATPWVGF